MLLGLGATSRNQNHPQGRQNYTCFKKAYQIEIYKICKQTVQVRKISFKFEIFYHFKTGFGIIRWSKNQAFHAFKLIDFPFNIHSILMFVFGLANC